MRQQTLVSLIIALAITMATVAALISSAASAESTASLAARALDGDRETRLFAIQQIAQEDRNEAIPALIRAMRYNRQDRAELIRALEQLTGHAGPGTWHEWMLWQQANPHTPTFDGHDTFLTRVFTAIDPAFATFIHPGVDHDIRLEEVVWGGVRKDGIPALTNPALISADEADYLTPGELVFGISINGDTRAYPFRIMDWHEMFNDVIGGVPVSLAYCTLCASGILFETSREEGDPFVFGSSGFLYRSNKLMYDQQTHSLWNQFTGRPVTGPLTGSGIELKTRPVAITTWSAWQAQHPDTKVLSLDTGYQRDYSPGEPYGAYFASRELMFPALVPDSSERLPKDYVFVLRATGSEKAWPLSDFAGGEVINDQAGVLPITLIGDGDTLTVRAYRTDGTQFQKSDDLLSVRDGATVWQVTEDALLAPDGRRFPRLPGHVAFWFAWAGYFGADES